MECCFDITEEQLNPLEDCGQWSATWSRTSMYHSISGVWEA